MEVRNRRSFSSMDRNYMWNTWRGKGLSKDEAVSSFFFNEFHDSCDAKEMLEIFKEYGLVVEVVILPRRDKRGKRYGFVQLRKVADKRILAMRLDNIYIQGKKIFAKIPRFQRRTNVV